jgi:hypothetical protein
LHLLAFAEALADDLVDGRLDKPGADALAIKVLKARHTTLPRVITVDKNAAYPPAIEETCLLRPCKYW